VFQSKDVDVKKFDDTKSILEFLKDVPANKRKTILSALVIATDNADYRDQMLGDIKTYNKGIATQEKTPEQEASWITMDEVKKIYDSLAKQANVLYKKETLSTVDLQEIQNFVIVSLLGGVFIPPRRSLDYTNFKIREIDPALNYLDKKTLVFNSYKTAKTYGQQTVECPPPLLKILKKFISVNKTDFLLFDTNGGKLSPVKLNQRLTKVLGKGRGVNSLRHSYLTGKYADTIKINEDLAADMTAMGSSSKNQSTTYIKKDS
jgi:integrase